MNCFGRKISEDFHCSNIICDLWHFCSRVVEDNVDVSGVVVVLREWQASRNGGPFNCRGLMNCKAYRAVCHEKENCQVYNESPRIVIIERESDKTPKNPNCFGCWDSDCDEPITYCSDLDRCRLYTRSGAKNAGGAVTIAKERDDGM